MKVIERTRFLSCRKFKRGIIQQKCKWSDHFLISAKWLVMLYICTKFSEIISNGIKVIERTRLLYGKLQKGNNSAKNVGGVSIFNPCMSSGHALYFNEVL